MQLVFLNVLFILILFVNFIKTATIWPGLFAQNVLRTPIFWPTTLHNTNDLNNGPNLQQSETNGHFLSSAEHHILSSDEPIPSGLFIPVEQIHRDFFNAPHLLRKHSSNHYPSFHNFNQYQSHNLNKKHNNSPKNKNTFYKNFENKFKNNKYYEDKPLNEKISYLNEEDFYPKQPNLIYNYNKMSGQMLNDYIDYNSDNLNKNWQKFKNNIEQENLPSFINSQEEQENDRDLFTIKNNSNDFQPIIRHKNGRIDLRIKNDTKLKNKEFKEIKKNSFGNNKLFKDNKHEINKNEKFLKKNFINVNQIDNLNDNRNEQFISNKEKIDENRNDGRILIDNMNINENTLKEKKILKGLDHVQNNPISNDLSMISEAVHQNHPSNKENQSNLNINNLEKENLSLEDKNNLLNLNNLHLENQPSFGTTWNAERIIPTPDINFMQTMLTETNTNPSLDLTTKISLASERSQINKKNHFSALAISAIVITSLIAALLFTGFSLLLMVKVSQIKKRRLMRFNENDNKNNFDNVFPVNTDTNSTTVINSQNCDINQPTNNLSSNIISNNNFIRQQKSLFSNLNTRCNASKTMLSIKESINPSNVPKNTKIFNKNTLKKSNKNQINKTKCLVTPIKTSTEQKNSALGRFLSKMANLNENQSTKELDENKIPIPPAQPQQRISFF